MTPHEIKRKSFYDKVLRNKVKLGGLAGYEDVLAEYLMFAVIVENNFFKYFLVW